MKKRILCTAIASLMALSMTACGQEKAAETAAPSAEETAAEAEESKAEETAAEPESPSAEGEGGTFIVGFDQDFPPMGFVGDDGEFTRRRQSVWDLRLRRSRLPGIQRIWSWSPAILTVSGTDLR